MGPEEKLKDLYPGLKRLEIDTHLDFQDDNEIHLLRIPRNVDPKLLLKFDFDIYEKNKLKIGDEKYVIQPTPRETNSTLVVSGEGKIVDLKSNILMKRYIKKKHPVVFKSEKPVMSLPNSRNRHPLFGTTFEEKIELGEDIEEKLNKALENLMKRDANSIKKKKKKKNDEDHSDEVIFSLLNSESSSNQRKQSVEGVNDDRSICSSSKKNKKAKKSLIEEANIKSELFTECETDSGIVSSTSKKNKKTKKSLIEESLRSIKNELFPDGETDGENMLGSAKKSKKSKKSIEGKYLSNNKSEIFTEYETDNGVTPTKKKKNKKSASELNCIPASELIKDEYLNNSLNFELGSTKSPTKKRKMSNSFARNSDSEEGGITEEFSAITTNEEKKIKKFKRNSTSNEIILNGFNTDEVSPSKKIKKKKKYKDLTG
ncbi:uncharacterized protein [Leptinotarsa decemlineata]|uniref:uncharacterized protein n=1 Tax=Leptinotarsa decemlineata TaxID=7539 RepID=UPI003D309102